MRLIRIFSPPIFILGLVSFITDVSSEMINPLLPIFITLLGGSGIAVGIVGAINESVSSLFKVYAGHLADLSGKYKKITFSGYLISCISKIILPFSTTWGMIAASRTIERIGKGIRTSPRDAIIAKVAKEHMKGRAFGFHRTMDTLGAITGTAICMLLIVYLGEGGLLLAKIRYVLLIGAIISFLGLIPFIFLKVLDETPSKKSFKAKIRSIDTTFKLYLISVALFSIGNVNYMFFILRVYKSGDPYEFLIISLFLYMIFNIVYAVTAYPFGKLSDKMSNFSILALGYICALISFTIMYMQESLFSFIISFILYGMAMGISDTLQRKISSLFPSEKGFTLGMYHTIYGFSGLVGGIVCGFLWDIRPELTFIFGAFMVANSLIVLASIYRRFK